MRRLLICLAILLLPVIARSQTPPPCLPNMSAHGGSCFMLNIAVACGMLPAGVSTLANYWAAYVCTLPTGYITTVYLGSLSEDAVNIVNYVNNTYTLAQGQADFKAQARVPTASEAAFIATQMATYRPRAVVAFNGASLTRSVFTVNPDGTFNPTPVAGEAVAVATPCNEAIRIANAPTYYNVTGQPNALGGTLPNGSYALCVVSFPIGTN